MLSGCTAPPPVKTLDRLSANEATQLQSYGFLSACSARVAATDQRSLHQFLGRNADPERDVIIASVPRSCNARIDAQRQTTLRNLIGMKYGRVKFEIGTGEDPAAARGIVRIAHIDGILVDQNNCAENSNCSVSNNLAAMISDPRDMFQPDAGNQYWPRPAAQSLSTGSELGISDSSS
jgi:type IV pilus biogenesis protein CpaD/CtpE